VLRDILMIKLGPLTANEVQQAAALLSLQEGVLPTKESELDEGALLLQGLSFWQHWVPFSLHVSPSIYVAREDKQVLGVIQLHYVGKSRGCWEIDKLSIHPQHRGRGIAQELLRYVFAQFGSQGASFFMAEVPALNEAALTLFANCGFCRSARVTYYRFNPACVREERPLPDTFRVALPHHHQGLFQLHSEVLPSALRQSLLLSADDFKVRPPVPFTSVERTRNKLMRDRLWYWLSYESERKVVTSAARVSARPGLGYRLEFFVNPGWKHISEDLVQYTVDMLLADAPHLPIAAKIYDYQSDLHDALVANAFERSGEAFLLCREHWGRAKHKKPMRTSTGLAQLTQPIIPLATDRTGSSDAV
jgi:ribosomal protein S18 acetylase RimI-like enzyme